MQKILFEVCANSLQSAIAAQLGGADHIELCSQLDAGGITPSAATIKLAVEQLDIPVYVLIRPRSGDFCYDDHDFELMKEDILFTKSLGAAGVVIGMLLPNGDIDVKRTSELVKLARPLAVTFHRAFDRACDPLSALEDVISTGADRILTSGQAATAIEGKDLLKTLVEKANRRITILAGAGINPVNVSEIINYTKVNEVHASCSVNLQSIMEYNNGMDNNKPITVTDVNIVKQIVTLLKNHQK